MIVAIGILVLLIISFLWALWSLKREMKNPREIDIVQEELSKEKIIFRA